MRTPKVLAVGFTFKRVYRKEGGISVIKLGETPKVLIVDSKMSAGEGYIKKKIVRR